MLKEEEEDEAGKSGEVKTKEQLAEEERERMLWVFKSGACLKIILWIFWWRHLLLALNEYATDQ